MMMMMVCNCQPPFILHANRHNVILFEYRQRQVVLIYNFLFLIEIIREKTKQSNVSLLDIQVLRFN